MYKQVLNSAQTTLLPLVKDFNKDFYLVGGTAIALQIGHRRSIDFDLFSNKALAHRRIINKITKKQLKPVVTRNVEEQLNLIISGVNFSFFHYPFAVNATLSFENLIQMPDLKDLAAMKAYALGRRARWKDYVDLYYILSQHFSISEISFRAQEIFGELYLEKQFRAQLAFFEEIDFTEEVEFLGDHPTDEQIKTRLTEYAVDFSR